MKTRTAALTAIAALALPVAAQAAKPAEPGKQGRDNAVAKQQSAKTKKVGFTLAGVLKQGEDFPAFTAVGENFTFAGPFELDLTSANRHARNAADPDIAKSAIKGDAVTLLDDFESDDQFKLNVVGITDAGNDGISNDLAAGDRVKVVGKVERTRNAKQKGQKQSYSFGEIDVRRVTVTREAPEPTS